MDALDVLRQLEGDSDDDFDGYLDEEEWDENMDGSSENGSEEPAQAATEGAGTTSASPSTSSASLQDYQGRSGCTEDMTNKTPVDFFSMFITEQMLQDIVQQTNLYAQQFLDSATNIPPRSRTNLWDKKSHDVSELRKFLSLVIVMGIIHFPSIEDYWVTSWPFSTNTFSDILKRDRFTLILRFFHLNDNTKYVPKGQPGHDPLFKIRPFMDKLIANFQCKYIPGRELSLDESMIGFKGRLGFVQYMPKKPTKWGLKAFVLADGESGYALNWKLYTGRLEGGAITTMYVYTMTLVCTIIHMGN